MLSQRWLNTRTVPYSSSRQLSYKYKRKDFLGYGKITVFAFAKYAHSSHHESSREQVLYYNQQHFHFQRNYQIEEDGIKPIYHTAIQQCKFVFSPTRSARKNHAQEKYPLPL